MSNRKKDKKTERTQIPQYGFAKRVQVDIPDDEVEVIKEVPAVYTDPETGVKTKVGMAYIHNDRSVTIRYDEDAPQWAIDKIKAEADAVGYSLETGGPIDGST